MINKKLLIGAGILLTIFIVFLIFLGGGSTPTNVPDEETLTQTITSVTCEIKEEENHDYEIDLLSNNVQFDSKLQMKNYTKINVNRSKNINALGVAFIVKSESDTGLNFTLMKNDEVLKTCSVTAKSGEVANVDLVLEESVNISTSDSYSIVVSQASDTNFVFDTVLFFIDSEE